MANIVSFGGTMAAVTKSDLAELLQVDRSRISQLARQGLPTTIDGKIDLEQALAWIAGRVGSGRYYADGAAARARALLRRLPEHPAEPNDDPLPSHMSWLKRCHHLQPDSKIVALVALEAAYRAPATIALTALAAGHSLREAFILQQLSRLPMAEMATEIAGIDPDDEGTVEWHPDAFWSLDWQALGASRGEEVDEARWDQEARDRWNSQASD